MPTIAITLRTFGLLLISTRMLLGGVNSSVSTATMKVYDEAPQQLVVYTDVPGAELSTKQIKSSIYTIKVRSAATGNQWVECFPHYTYNRALELPDIDPQRATSTQNYLNHTAGWSQTYANIEMTPNTTVEVEIGRVGTTQINGSTSIFKSAVHPAQKMFGQKTEGGKAYFMISNPGQFVIDINGQMDDHNAVLNPLPGNPPIHTVTLFANPVIAKPAMTGPGILSIAPSASHPPINGVNTNPGSAITTIAFQPGVHRIGQHFNIFPGKKYYIPGDAIILGTLNNNTAPLNGYRSQGDSITIYGYGTLNGIDFPHSDYAYAYPDIPDAGSYGHRGIVVEGAVNFFLEGITIADTPNFATSIENWPPADDRVVNHTVRWSKVITWKANGDGYGGVDLIEDSFLRTNDDANYVKGSRRRLTTWKDGAAQMFRVPQLPVAGTRFPYVIEDCDVIYNRTRDNGAAGNVSHVFDFDGAAGTGVIATDLTIRNIRLHDRRGNTRLFNFKGEPSYTGIRIENIAAKLHTPGRPSTLQGTVNSPWNGWPIFKNVIFDDGTNNVPLTVQNFGTYFETNEFVSDLQVEPHQNFALTAISADPTRGYVSLNPNQATYLAMSTVTLTAVANPGYRFMGWSGDDSSPNNPLAVVMTANKTLTANFDLSSALAASFTTSGTHDWVCPEEVTRVTVECWGSGGAAGSASSTASGGGQARSGGGAGGSYAKNVNFAVTPGTSYKVIVGTGGSPVTSVTTHNQAEPGQTGGDSKLMDAALATEYVKAVGGAGGRNALKTSGAVNVNGGGGSTTGSIGDVVFAGGSGGDAGATSVGGTGAGGGGGGAGNAAPGGSPSFAITAGIGGVAGGGDGGVGRGAVGPPNTLPTAPGGGGGGVVVASSGSTTVGAAGGDGKVIITYNTTTFTLNTQAVNGGITLNPAGGTYPAGTEVTVTALPGPGYRFSGWSGDLAGSGVSQMIVMNNSKTVTAGFELIIPTLSSGLDGPDFMVSWPLTSPGWTLEWSNTLESDSWTEVPPPYPTNESGFIWQGTLPPDKCFYRLRRP